MTPIDWSDSNTHWGEVGFNVHVADNGSHVADAHSASEVTE